MDVEILYTCPALAVCVKPPGILSQAGDSGEQSMPAALEAVLGAPVYPVHRLDRQAGGVMVFARTKQAAADLSEQIRSGSLEKEYLAALTGVPGEASGLLEDLLYHDSRRNKTYVVDRKRKGVREARLRYRVLAEQDGQALVQVRLLTGRTHQIRAQFASRGLPLAGDGPYGGGKGGLQLWSVSLGLTVPGLGFRRFVRPPEHLGTFTHIPAIAPMEETN